MPESQPHRGLFLANHKQLERLGMLTDSEGSEEALPSGETQDKVSNSPSGDTSVPSTNTDISEVPTIIETSQLSKNVNSPETLPPRQTSESEELSEALPKYENTKPHTEKDLETFSTSDISVYKSDTTTLFKAAGAKESPDSSCKRKRQTSDVKEPEVTGVINEAFELLQSTDDVQVGHVFKELTMKGTYEYF